jgi:hypothetical protein
MAKCPNGHGLLIEGWADRVCPVCDYWEATGDPEPETEQADQGTEHPLDYEEMREGIPPPWAVDQGTD